MSDERGSMMRISWAALGCFALIACGPPPVTDICKGRLAGDLVITEIMIDPEGTDTGAEWFEIYNTLGTDIDLKGMVLTYRDTDGSGAKSHVIKAGTAKSQGYFTVGDIRSGALPAWIGYTYGDGLGSFGNARGVVGIKCGTTIFDEVTWTRAAKSNRSRMLDPAANKSATENDDETKWCDTQIGTVYTANSAGTPGAANVACLPEAMVGTCVEAGTIRQIRVPGPGDLIITEIMANPKLATSASSGAWFEVLATKAVDLNDLTIAAAVPNSDTDVKSGTCIPVSPGEYVLFARSADTFVNGNLPAPKLTYSLTITTGNNRLYLRRGDAGIDEASFTTSSTGVSVQLDSRKLDTVSNDDPANFCRATQRLDAGMFPDGGLVDLGSPGAPNETCPNVDGGMDAGPVVDAGDPNSCFDVGTNAFRPIVKASTGDLVVTEFMADPSAVTDAMGEWFEVLVKGTADLNGLLMTGSSTTGVTGITSTNCVRYDAGTLLVFANNADKASNGNINALPNTIGFSLVNSNGRILLYTDAGTVDQVTWIPTVAAGRSRQLDVTKQDAVQNDVATNFCDGDAGILLLDGGAGDKGTPGTANRTCP